MIKKSHFYITTPIYYVTARPHLGSLYSTLLADVYARWQKLHGANVFFLTGTDEHGQKIAAAAAAAKKEPHAFVDGLVGAYQDVWKQYNFDYNYFIRTTDPNHKKTVQAVLQKLIEKGDIYKSTYQGWYCTPCETFLTEREATLIDGQPLCPSCQRTTHPLEEETYFFRLSAYEQKLIDWYEKNPQFIIPTERAHEVLSFVRSGLHDISVSRTGVKWGIAFPNDPLHVAYVWIDALLNYVSALGYMQPNNHSADWWPASVQVIGKDIIRFHAVIWPALLMALELQPPQHLLVHGWLKIGEHKMSKSRGNVVDPVELATRYGVDAVRYYLTRYTSMSQDSEFSEADLVEKYNADLANSLSNLLHRMTTLADRFDRLVVKPPALWREPELQLRDQLWSALDEYELYMNGFNANQALAVLWRFIGQINSYVQQQEPWKLVKSDSNRFDAVLSAVCHAFHAIAFTLLPVIPDTAQAFLQRLGASSEAVAPKNLFDTLTRVEENHWTNTFTLLHTHPVCMRLEPIKIETDQSAKPDKKITPSMDIDTVSIDELQKIHLVIGTIKECHEVAGSSKLWRLTVDCGTYGLRQILSGIRPYFSIEQLRDHQALFVLNLAPRTLMGYTSEGMLFLAKDNDGNARLVHPSGPLLSGTRLS